MASTHQRRATSSNSTVIKVFIRNLCSLIITSWPGCDTRSHSTRRVPRHYETSRAGGFIMQHNSHLAITRQIVEVEAAERLARVRPSRLFGALVLISAALLFSSQLALAQFTQQGPKLVGTGAVGAAEQGFSVALSADGNTAIVGGLGDNGVAPGRRGSSPAAAVSGPSRAASWSAPARLEAARQGISVALSADGNTAIVGGPGDNANAGAAWVFTRSGGVWTQQGSKLVGTGAVGTAAARHLRRAVRRRQHRHRGRACDNTDTSGRRGSSPAAAASGPSRATSWSAPARLEAPSKAAPSRCPPTATPPSWAGLATTAAPGRRGSSPAAAVSGPSRATSWSAPARLEPPIKAISVALSADGNTAIVGGANDNSDAGAAWVFTRSGGVWTQQGSKLVGTGAVGARPTRPSPSRCPPTATPPSWAGLATTASPGRRGSITRSGGVWTQQGSKLVGTGAVGAAQQGISVALSADGNTAIVGGPDDNGIGAAWVFVQPAAGVLQVSPTTNIAAFGIRGGAFSPASFSYQLSSTSSSVNYSISGIPPWLNANFTSGTATTTPVTVTFSLINIGGLTPGTYAATIAFTNTSNGRNTTRTATLLVNAGTKDGCKDGGWQNYISSPGPFKNQGQCASYFAKQ